MKIMKLLILIFLLAQILFVPTASAYEGILHYAWTYYLALQVGYTERQAYQIASATNAIDWDPQTNPVASPLDTRIDTVFGADRFRYFDATMNKLWVELDKEMKNDSSILKDKDKNATFLKLMQRQKKHLPATMFRGAWQNYYDALTVRNPAVRTWVKLHAFQPIVLQEHMNEELYAIIDFTSDPEFISIDSPLTKFTQDEAAWKDSWAEYLILNNERATWTIGKQLEKPEIKNGSFSQLDAETFELFNETISVCYKKSIKSCFAELCNSMSIFAAKQEIEMLQCDEKISIKELVGTFNKLPDKFKKGNRKLIDFDRRGIRSEHQDELIARPLRSFMNLVEKINRYQEKTKLSWPLVYSALMQDIQTYVINEFWNPQTPRQLSDSHSPTRAVNAVRGEAVKQLWELAQVDRNPGPLLHYIQDLQAHGPYNTYNGHALANHAPDFIDQNTRYAVNATIDSVIILCEFKEKVLDVISAINETGGPEGLFVGRFTVDSELCKSGKRKAMDDSDEFAWDESKLRDFITKHSLTGDDSNAITLEDILVELGKQSYAPELQKSHVTWALAEKIITAPPHFIDGYETTEWTNEKLGLPDFPGAVRYLSEQVSLDLLPVWRNYYLRLEDRLENYLVHIFAQSSFTQPELYTAKKAWKPAKIPTSVIQYDYDYCGRVYKADFDRETRKGLPEWFEDNERIVDGVEQCNKTSANSRRKAIERPANTLYMLEAVSINIKDMSVVISSDKPTYSWKLNYKIHGMLPGLNGNYAIKITKPKSLAKWAKVQKEASTDMFSTNSKIDFGPNALLVYENCQLLIPLEDDVRSRFKSIVNGKYKENGMESDNVISREILDYLNVKWLSDKSDQYKPALVAGLLSSKARRIIESEHVDKEMSSKGTTNKTGVEVYIDRGADVYMACSVHVQGQSPVVAINKASRGVISEVIKVTRGTQTK